LGLAFTPSPVKKPSFQKFSKDLDILTRSLKRNLYFREHPFVNPHSHIYRKLGIRSDFNPPQSFPQVSEFARLVRRDTRNFFFRSTKYSTCNNLSPSQYSALRHLREDSRIKIVPADKGGRIVVLDTMEYEQKMLNILTDTNTYERVTWNYIELSFAELLHNISILQQSVPDKIWNWISKPFESPSVGKMYGLPKVHKIDIPPRPILPGCDTPTERLALLAEFCLKDITPLSESYIRDSFDFIEKLKKVEFLEGSLLCTADIKLYVS
jgi:hypothetical protein